MARFQNICSFPPMALYQNCYNGSAWLNRMEARAKNRKTFKRHLLHSQPTSVAQLDARLTGDQVVGSTPTGSGTFFQEDLIMKYFLWSFSPFRWFKKGSCQFSEERMYTLLVKRLED